MNRAAVIFGTILFLSTLSGVALASQICLNDFNAETQRQIEDGIHKRYHENGKLENVQEWKKGCMISSEHYDQQERPKAQSIWDNKGKLQMGQWSYFDNGELAMEYAYNEATKEGFRKHYHENGQEWKAIEIKKGKVARYVEYDTDGNIVVEEVDPKKLVEILDPTIE